MYSKCIAFFYSKKSIIYSSGILVVMYHTVPYYFEWISILSTPLLSIYTKIIQNYIHTDHAPLQILYLSDIQLPLHISALTSTIWMYCIVQMISCRNPIWDTLLNDNTRRWLSWINIFDFSQHPTPPPPFRLLALVLTVKISHYYRSSPLKISSIFPYVT